ncbi:MAG: hypothetical protein LBP53_04540 [Candidatus Peribacteria bacterium]|nr:hypothetical protein [Candidatus Peribacteria bacterium]
MQKFKTTIPLEKKAILKADGKNIPCKSVCFHSGNITSKVTICSSLSEIPNFDKIQSPIIVFNPYCEQISRQIFFLNAPAIAIKYRDVNKVLVAKRIEGKVVIEPTTYTARNILVGNTKNPKNICFAHYDSWYY